LPPRQLFFAEFDANSGRKELGLEAY